MRFCYEHTLVVFRNTPSVLEGENWSTILLGEDNASVWELRESTDASAFELGEANAIGGILMTHRITAWALN